MFIHSQMEAETSSSSQRQVLLLKASTKNNVCAFLDPSSKNAGPFVGIIEFLSRSRIVHAITHSCTPYASPQRAFWNSAHIDCEVDPPVIVGQISGKTVTVSADIIRRMCDFKDHHEDPIILDKYLVRGCFMRLRYDGDVCAGVLNKANLCPQYKYLAHILLHCLGSRRGGFDEMRETIQSAFVALVLNIPFNFSEMVFTHMKENVTLKRENAYLMYPRFLQMIIDDQLPDLHKIDTDRISLDHMNDLTLNRVTVYRGRQTKPPHKRLIGHLANRGYVAPGGRKWRHDDSGSDMEDIVVPPRSDGDDDDNDEQGGPRDQGGSAGEPQTTTTATPASITVAASSTPSGFDPEDINLDDILTQGSDSDKPDNEYEIVQVGSRMVSQKKKRKASEAVVDAEYIPTSTNITLPESTQTTPSKKEGRKKAKAKRKRFVLQRISETSQAATSTRTSFTAATVPPPQASETMMPIYTEARAEPSTSRVLPSVSVTDQLSALNNLVLQLLSRQGEQDQLLAAQAERNRQQDLQIQTLSEKGQEQDAEIALLIAKNKTQKELLDRAIESNRQQDMVILQMATANRRSDLRIQALEDENKRIQAQLEGRSVPSLKLKGKADDNDDDDDEYSDEEDESTESDEADDVEGGDGDGGAKK